MNAAIIVLTILGCDDSATDCHYIATSDKRWPSIEMCSAVSEMELASYANAPYPIVIAVCQKPDETEVAASPDPTPAVPARQTDLSPEETTSLASRAIARVRAVLPTTKGVRTLMQKPIGVVEESYSWIAKKFRN